MDGSAIEHSDSESGDSWTLLDNSSHDAIDVADHPTASSAPEHNDKDEDTDGISIITDSEPDSPSPCQIDNDQYLPEENSTEVHFSQYTPLNSQHSNMENCHEHEMKDDILGDNTAKHKTYVHRRNKRLSAVLNIIMLGSIITAAGIAIGHMWGARTDCSMHSTTNVNKILSNLYKLQEENAYLRGKLKEFTAFNYPTNQQKTANKQNKCKKIFEEPLINTNSKKATKCVDENVMNDNIPLKSQMTKVAGEPLKNSKNYNKKLEELFKLLQQRYISKNINNPEKLKYLNDLLEIKKKYEDQKYSDEFMNETNDLRYEMQMYLDTIKYIENIQGNKGYSHDFTNDDSWNEINTSREPETDTPSSTDNDLVNEKIVRNKKFKNTKDNYLNKENKIRGVHVSGIELSHEPVKNMNKRKREVNSVNEFTINEKHENVKNKENKTFSKNDTASNNYPTDDKIKKTIDKNQQKKVGKDHDASEEIIDICDMKLKGDIGPRYPHKPISNPTLSIYAITLNQREKIKELNKLKYSQYKDEYQISQDPFFYTSDKYLKPKGDYGNTGIYINEKNEILKDPNFFTAEKYLKPKGDYGTLDDFINKNIVIKSSRVNKVVKTSADKTDKLKDEYGTEGDFLKIKKDKKIKGQREIDSDDDIKKDNRYSGQKKKQERKKYDRQQAHKKIKRRNKYEQWEMKGGLLKEFDDISWSSSSQESESFDEPELVDNKNYIHRFDNIDKNPYMSDSEKQEKKDELQTTKESNDKDEVNWSDERAMLRKMARKRLEEELFGKGSGNTAGWYFRRMRKREQRRGNSDNSTYRKLLKRQMNYKLKK